MMIVQVHPDDVFYECNGAGDCGTPAHYVPGQQWGLNKVGAPQAWKYTTGSSKVKVCFPPLLGKPAAPSSTRSMSSHNSIRGRCCTSQSRLLDIAKFNVAKAACGHGHLSVLCSSGSAHVMCDSCF